MIVYGDPQYEESLGALLGRLAARLHALMGPPARPDIEGLRALLVMAGEVEQAASDVQLEPEDMDEWAVVLRGLRSVTADAATAFKMAWLETNGSAPAAEQGIRAALLDAERILAGMPGGLQETLTVKVPEGFAFYALYPEQYIAAAHVWAQEHEAAVERGVVVVGVRSIGTSLSALVVAALNARGWQARSLTVRPDGHPFRRDVEIAAAAVAGAAWGLVVDEGPGLSGSSMAATGAALVRAGLPRERIAFFPAHDREPGSAASSEVRAWWATIPRYVTSGDAPIYAGRSLRDALASAVLTLCGEGGSAGEIVDLGGGQWRDYVYREPSQWPAACAPFERPKYLCTTPEGARISLKYEGLATAPGSALTMAGAAYSRMERLAGEGWGPAPVGNVFGFVLRPWVEGQPLAREDASPATLAHVGRYIAASSEASLSHKQQEEALTRLREMLYWNTWEALGEEAAARTYAWCEAGSAEVLARLPRSYGDGRMAPQEWLRTTSGRLLKVDNTGHRWDHTAIGPQAIAWDLAGAITEWEPDEAGLNALLDAYAEAGGERFNQATLAFFRMAYLSFKLGICSLCAEMSGHHDPGEQARQWTAYARYRDELARLLTVPVDS